MARLLFEGKLLKSGSGFEVQLLSYSAAEYSIAMLERHLLRRILQRVIFDPLAWLQLDRDVRRFGFFPQLRVFSTAPRRRGRGRNIKRADLEAFVSKL